MGKVHPFGNLEANFLQPSCVRLCEKNSGRNQSLLCAVAWLWTNVILPYMCVKITKDALTSESQGFVKCEGHF